MTDSDIDASAIPVICDRCRITGIAGLGDFSHLGDLLDFTPVPRAVERVNGWTPDRQRGFIAALAATGSRRRAAHALGMSAYGVVNLQRSAGAESFNAAYDRALAIAKAHGSLRLASEVADVAARNAVLKPPPSKLRDWKARVSSVRGTDEGECCVAGDHSSPILNAAINASCGMLTLPYSRILFLPSFCFSKSFRFRVASPP